MSNPLTALEFIKMSEDKKSTCIVQTAGAGSLGTILNKLAKEKNINVINIVYGEEDKKILTDLNVNYILDTKSPDYINELRNLIYQLKPNILFDSVVGQTLSDLLVFMPPKSDIILYGWLSQEVTTFSNGLLIMHEKNIKY